MYSVVIKLKEEEKELQRRNFGESQDKAEKYFNLLKMDIVSHKRDAFYDEPEGIKYSDIILYLFKDDEEISHINK